MRALLDAAGTFERAIDSFDDQEVLHYMFMHTPWRARMHLDQDNRCLASAHNSNGQGNVTSGRWVHTVNRGAPAVVHYNGGSKGVELKQHALRTVPAALAAWGDPALAGGAFTAVAQSWGATGPPASMAAACAAAAARASATARPVGRR